MTEQQKVSVNGKDYDWSQMTEPCRNLFVRAQNGQNALNLMAQLVELARVGQEVIQNVLMKLLPEDDEAPAAEGEVIN